jgi:hypothetical protein
LTADDRRRLATLRGWVTVLVLWPLVLLVLPIQDHAVQLVGFRASVFLLGFVILGARLSGPEMYRIAVWCAILNVAVFGVAVAEFVLGIEPFFPRNTVTEIMYRSRVLVADQVAGPTYRIPGTFSSAHAYGGTMVMTVPLLLGAWVESRHSALRSVARPWQSWLLIAALLAAVLGVFMAAARHHMVMLFIVLLAATLAGRMRISYRAVWVGLLLVVGAIVARDPRLQRFTTLEDDEYVRERVRTSVNETFIDYARRYPMGVGLGAGGTSIPYFLMDRLDDATFIENEYGRIMLEQGIPGLVLWVGFIVWFAARGLLRRPGQWQLGGRLAWVMVVSYFLSAAIGLGLMASIPQSYVFFLLIGWVAALPRGQAVLSRRAAPPVGALARAS